MMICILSAWGLSLNLPSFMWIISPENILNHGTFHVRNSIIIQQIICLKQIWIWFLLRKTFKNGWTHPFIWSLSWALKVCRASTSYCKKHCDVELWAGPSICAELVQRLWLVLVLLLMLDLAQVLRQALDLELVVVQGLAFALMLVVKLMISISLLGQKP